MPAFCELVSAPGSPVARAPIRRAPGVGGSPTAPGSTSFAESAVPRLLFCLSFCSCS